VFEQDLASAWIAQRLATVTTWDALGLGTPARIGEAVVIHDWTEQGSYIVYSLQTPEVRDVSATDQQDRIMADSLWLVKAVAKGSSFVPVRKLARAIDLVLDRTSGAVALDDFAGTIMACVRVGTVRYAELDQTGTPWKHQGVLYRIQVQ